MIESFLNVFDVEKAIFSICRRVFKRHVLDTRKHNFRLSPAFSPFPHNVFYHFQNRFQFLGYNYFVVCKCFEFGPVQNVVVW